MKIQSIVQDIENHKEFQAWHKQHATCFLAHVFMMIDKKGMTWQLGYCDGAGSGDEMITTVTLAEDMLTISKPEKAFKKPGSTIKALKMGEVQTDVPDVLTMLHDLQHKKYPAELPVKKIVVLQNIAEGQVYNVTYVTQTMKTLNIKVDAGSGKVVSEKLEEVFSFDKGA